VVNTQRQAGVNEFALLVALGLIGALNVLSIDMNNSVLERFAILSDNLTGDRGRLRRRRNTENHQARQGRKGSGKLYLHRNTIPAVNTALFKTSGYYNPPGLSSVARTARSRSRGVNGLGISFELRRRMSYSGISRP